MMAGLGAFLRDKRGAAAAEMALMLPLLTTLLFVTFEGGYFLWNQHKVVKGVRDGARYAGRLDFSKYDCATGTVKDVASDYSPALKVVDTIKNVTRTGFPNGDNPNIAGTDNPTVTGWSNIGSGVTVTLSCASGQGGIYSATAGNAPRVTVSAAVPYPSSPLSDLVGVLGFDTSSISLRASAQSAVMGL